MFKFPFESFAREVALNAPREGQPLEGSGIFCPNQISCNDRAALAKHDAATVMDKVE